MIGVSTMMCLFFISYGDLSCLLVDNGWHFEISPLLLLPFVLDYFQYIFDKVLSVKNNVFVIVER